MYVCKHTHTQIRSAESLVIREKIEERKKRLSTKAKKKKKYFNYNIKIVISVFYAYIFLLGADLDSGL